MNVEHKIPTINCHEMPTVSCYADYRSGNYGVNALRVSFSFGDFYFSYKTLIAFRIGHNQLVVRQNDWNTTTEKHLNAIDGGDKKSRLSGSAFEAEYARQSAEFGGMAVRV